MNKQQRIFSHSRIPRVLAYVLAAMLVVTLTISRVEAASGNLDTSFGTGGFVITDLGRQERATSVAVQPDGRIVIGIQRTPFNAIGGGDFMLLRYNVDGTLDNSFGTGGVVQTNFLGYGGWVNSVKIDSRNRILAAGLIFTAPTGYQEDFAVARYNANGSLDTSFGSGGKVTSDNSVFDTVNAIAIQKDGKIVAAGYSNGSFAIFRLTVNGAQDLTFAGGDVVLTHFYNASSEVKSIVLQSDGRIVAGGSAWTNDSVLFGLARYNTDGTLDTTFGGDGMVTTRITGRRDLCNQLFIRPVPFGGEQIIAAGSTISLDDRACICMAGYLPDGSLNAAFGAGGIALTDFGYGECAVQQPDGKIVVAGWKAAPHFTLARYNSNGTLDANFGFGGKVITTAFLGAAYGLALTSHSEIIAVGAGYVTSFDNDDIAIAKYLP